MKEAQTNVGVVIGRFQVDCPHSEHLKIIKDVLERHEKVVIFLGTTVAVGTKENPMDFITRKVMLEEFFGNEISMILPIADQKFDEDWSKLLDYKIREVFYTESITLYGSRDSFAKHYLGKFKVVEFIPEVFVSGTEIREEISRQVISSPLYRKGLIKAAYQKFPNPYPTVDIIIRDSSRILLAQKPHDRDKWRFIGGFVDVGESYELAAKREVGEESGLEIGNLRYILSAPINDWRYRGIKGHGITTTLFEAQYIFGAPKPMDDISNLKWFELSEVTPGMLVGEHCEMFKTYLEWLK